MTPSVMDTFLIGLVLVHEPTVCASPPPPPPQLSPWLQLMLLRRGGVVMGRRGVELFFLRNQQQGELQVMGHAARMVDRFGWSSASVVGDNTATLASMRKLSATPRAVTQNKIAFNLLWWSGTLLHLSWVKSKLCLLMQFPAFLR